MPSMSQASSSSHAASTYPVRILKKSEYKQAALCLAEAFEDDEVVQYAIQTGDRKNSTPEKDWKLHLHMMECIADIENRVTYLECSNPLNIKLYSRLGFKLAKKIYLTRGEKPVEMDIMTRLPVAQQLAGRTLRFHDEQESRN
ncbi:hypothetical protein OEA41_001803 [Lepraria neglecta]|uniref:N-acetyltransferase domain-containing protein n=1 Tax=Lepraria neglecta TaxID=209136 RepID=A0AAE0DLT1_9LECA|nr:hypothetical protein OEA41_001803 [Lepraria neglecta]